MRYVSFVFAVISLCLFSFLDVDAQQSKGQQRPKQKVSKPQQSKDKPTPDPTSNKQKPPTSGQKLVPEASDLLKYNNSTGFTGNFTFKGGDDCYSFSYSGTIKSVGLARIYDVWAFRRTYVNGVRHEFSSAVCFPVGSGGNYITRVNLPSKFSLASGTQVQYGDRYVSIIGNGDVSISGDGTVVDYSGPVFRIEGDPHNLLILELTSSGYKYISGKGKLTTPAGKTYIFP